MEHGKGCLPTISGGKGSATALLIYPFFMLLISVIPRIARVPKDPRKGEEARGVRSLCLVSFLLDGDSIPEHSTVTPIISLAHIPLRDC